MKMKILFFSPHPDDIEFACASTEIELVNKGYEVIQALFTADEYGTNQNEFKGERISRIRRWEMREAAKVIGLNKIYWLGYIDGYSRFDKESVERLKKFWLRIDPDVVFAPDPFYTLDSHVDHMNLAKNVLYIWKLLKKKPPLLLYYTYKPNYYIPSGHRKQAIEAFKKHISQGFSNPIFVIFSWLLKTINGIFAPHAVFAEAYRIPSINKKRYKNPIRPPPFIKKIILRVLSLLGIGRVAFMVEDDLYKPTPQELGVKDFRFRIED